MERPYVICHILSALDGRISGPFMETEAVRPAQKAYGSLREQMGGDAWLYGTTTMKDFTGFRKPELAELETGTGGVLAEKDLAAEKDVPAGVEEDFVARHSEDFYMVSIDTLGEIGWEKNIMSRGGKTAHIIEILIGDTPVSYRMYLKRKGISYIQAGTHRLDCKEALRKLYRLFGIQKLLVCGGGGIDWTFLNQKALDELSLVLAPAADGGAGPSVFEAGAFLKNDGENGQAAAQFQLKKVKELDGGALWLVYRVVSPSGDISV